MDGHQLRGARIHRDMMLVSSVCRRALGCEWGGGINKDGPRLAQQESSGTSRAKERDMEAKASKHASKCEHARARARARQRDAAAERVQRTDVGTLGSK